MYNSAMAFQTYQSFASTDDAQQLIGILIDNNIQFQLEKNQPDINPIFVGTLTNLDVLVKIDENDFEKVNELFKKTESVKLEDLDPGYYMFNFTEEELMEVILKPDEWNNYDYQIAKLLLQKKGTQVNEVLESGIKKKREEELTTSKEINGAWIIFGYICSFLGGAVGIGIGIYIWLTLKTMHNGKKQFAFSPNNRAHGKAITIIGIVVFLIVFLVNLCRRIEQQQSEYW